jgi:Uma2 family endonuclease
MTDAEFVAFCAQYPDYFIEVSADGDILVMPPSDFLTSAQITKIVQQLANWSDSNRQGWVTESSGGFVLPNGARRAPDVAWFSGKSSGVPDHGKRPRFPHFAPDFVIELRSPDDRLSRLRPKMREWVDNGAKLAWLIDPERRVVEIYRPDHEPEFLDNVDSVAGEGPVQGFVLDLRPSGIRPGRIPARNRNGYFFGGALRL